MRLLILPAQREQRLGRSRPPVKAAHQCAGFRDAWFAVLCSPWRYLRNAERADTLPVLQEPGGERSRVCPAHSRRRSVPMPHMPRDMAPSERSGLAPESGLAGTHENQRRLILSNARHRNAAPSLSGTTSTSSE